MIKTPFEQNNTLDIGTPFLHFFKYQCIRKEVAGFILQAKIRLARLTNEKSVPGGNPDPSTPR